jgi:hypothetical protein
MFPRQFLMRTIIWRPLTSDVRILLKTIARICHSPKKQRPKCKAARKRLHSMPQCHPGRELTVEHHAKLSMPAKRREARERAKRVIVAEQPTGRQTIARSVIQAQDVALSTVGKFERQCSGEAC